jgi:hypothetical protein
MKIKTIEILPMVETFLAGDRSLVSLEPEEKTSRILRAGFAILLRRQGRKARFFVDTR